MNEAIVVFSRKGLFQVRITAREVRSREHARKMWPLVAPGAIQQMVTWVSPSFENGKLRRRSHFRQLPVEKTYDLTAQFESEEFNRRRTVNESVEHQRAKSLIAAELTRRLVAGLAMPWAFKDDDASDYPFEGNLLLGADRVATEYLLDTPFGSRFRLDIAVLGPPIQTEPMVLGGVEIELGHAFDGRKALIGKSLGFALISIDITQMTMDEITPHAAYAEAAKSACLSKQVGAAVVSEKGELIGLGRNDVPQFGGGLYTEDAGAHDHRCHAWQDKRCHNDKKKDVLYQQIFDKLKSGSLLAEGARIEDVTKAVKATDIKSLIEYSRAVHAEMDAITSVARTHKAGLLGGTLYSTTFPCHSCARHIVASGVKKVLFIEPYPKSLATELHSDAVSESESDEGKRVLFLQFSGIAPRNVLRLFNLGLTRKSGDGKLVKFDKKTASPVVKVSLDDYSTHEKWVIAELAENEQQASQGKQPALFGV